MVKSSKPNKQRKEIYNGKFNKIKKEMRAHLSKSLKEKYTKRNFSVIVDDSVKILRGKFKGQEGKVERVNLKKRRVFVEGVQKSKADGTFAKIGVSPSNLIITTLNLKDKRRKEKIEGNKKEIKKEKPKEAKK